jgi:hypothetical protein
MIFEATLTILVIVCICKIIDMERDQQRKADRTIEENKKFREKTKRLNK